MLLPFVLTNGTQLDADELMANLNALRDALDQVRNSNIVDNAGIDKSKLAQPGNGHTNSFLLVPATSNGSLDTAADANFTLPAASQRKHKTRIRLGAGQIAALCEIDVEPEEVVIGGADWPVIEILVDGVQYMGQTVTLDTSLALYAFGNANPVDGPGYPLGDNSIIEYKLFKTGAGAPTIRQCSVSEQIKRDAIAM